MQTGPILQTDLPLPLFGRGKVRDTYDLGSELLMVATDRISAFDSVLPTGIPYKGQVLTALSAFWFRRTAQIMPNHLISWERRDFPFDWQSWPEEQQAQLVGRAMLVKKAERIDIECVARGYLAGSGWKEYDTTGAITGIKLPHGMVPSQQLPEPIFTPATKAASGHDENITFERMVDLVGQELAEELREATLAIYTAISEHSRQHGVIVADTKLEFGLLDGQLIVIDELGTPDSSRFWEVTKYRFGEDQASLDKQYVRDWLLQSGWDREPPAPPLPDEVAQKTSEKYLEAYRQLVGHDLNSDLQYQ
ncbi:MAG TPA: phosphoribosylaminoimidazolesuccinocarboxamide synthase [Chloroflexia bacterium]